MLEGSISFSYCCERIVSHVDGLNPRPLFHHPKNEYYIQSVWVCVMSHGKALSLKPVSFEAFHFLQGTHTHTI